MSKVDPETTTSIIGLVVEFIVAIDEARVRFTDDALFFFSLLFFLLFFFFLVYLFFCLTTT